MVKTEFERALELVKDLYTVNYTELSEEDIKQNETLAAIYDFQTQGNQLSKQMRLKTITLVCSLIILATGIALSSWICFTIISSTSQPRSLEWVALVVIALATLWWLYAGLTDIRDFIRLKKACKLPPRVLRFPEVSIEALITIIRFYTKFDVVSQDRTIPDIYAIVRPGFRPVLINACDCELNNTKASQDT